ncbi:MAG TPA: hypothetical protein VHJ17_25050 [Thermomonospora sp.]|nr:hypothetical protein [Thermomonospora sp.]
MKHCRVEHFEVFGEPDAEVAAGLRSSLGAQIPLTFSSRVAGFLRLGSAPRTQPKRPPAP